MSSYRHTMWHPLRIVTVIAAVAALAACGDKPEQQSMAGMKVPVSVVQVQPEAAPLTVELPGRVDATEEAQVRARVTGVVEQINFDQGADVKEGDLLFTIDAAPYKAALDKAAADVQNAEAAVKVANSLAQRYGTLVKKNAISRQEYDNAMAQQNQAKANVAAAKAALQAAEIDLGYTKVTAPISGRIGKAEVTKGALVSAAEATHLATIQYLDQMYVDITRPVNEIMDLRKAIEAGSYKADTATDTKVSAILSDRTEYDHIGRLLFSGMSVDPSTGQVNMRALFPNPNHDLLPGMFVRVRIEQAIDENALLVPAQAVQYSGSGATTLMLVKDDKATIAPVQTGQQLKGRIQITKGLEAGDTVIVEGFQKVRPDAPVQAMPWKGGETEAPQIKQAEQAEQQANPDAPADSSSTADNG